MERYGMMRVESRKRLDGLKERFLTEILGGPSVVDIAVWEVILNGWRLKIAGVVTWIMAANTKYEPRRVPITLATMSDWLQRVSKSAPSPVQPETDILSYVVCLMWRFRRGANCWLTKISPAMQIGRAHV